MSGLAFAHIAVDRWGAFDSVNGRSASWQTGSVTDEALLDLVRRHNALALRAERRLREYLASKGLPTGDLLVRAWRGIGVDQRGLTAAGDHYAFHGAGCVIGVQGEHAVDIDWESDGRILVDVWHILGWIECTGHYEASRESIGFAAEELARTGEIEAVGSRKYRLAELQ